MKVVLLFSGGIDSTVLLWQLLKDRRDVAALTVSYGQRHVREIDAANALAKVAGVRHEICTVSGAVFGGSALTGAVPLPSGAAPDDSAQSATVVPNRNMVLLGLGAALAIAEKREAVYFAAHAGDAQIYRDCRPEFVEALGEALSLAHEWPVDVRAPFLGWAKADVVRRGERLGVPWGLTWSCYAGGGTPCGACGACLSRATAFTGAGVVDSA